MRLAKMVSCYKYHIPNWAKNTSTLSGAYDKVSLVSDCVEAFCEMALLKSDTDKDWEKAVYWSAGIPNDSQMFVDSVLSALIFIRHGFRLPLHHIAGFAQTPGDEGREYPKETAAYTMPEAYDGDTKGSECGIFYNEKCIRDISDTCYLTAYYRYGSPLCILHELGHWLNHRFSGMRRKAMQRSIALNVSYYGAYIYAEFMAEVLSSIMLGRTFSNEVINYIDNTEDGKLSDKIISNYHALLAKGLDNAPKAIQGVTPDTLASYQYSSKQRSKEIYRKHFEYLSNNIAQYGKDMRYTYCVDLFCNVMNEDCTVIYHAPSMPYAEPSPMFKKGEFVYIDSYDLLTKTNKCFQVADTLYYSVPNADGDLIDVCQLKMSQTIKPKYDIDFVNRILDIPMKFKDIDLEQGNFIYKFGSRGKMLESGITEMMQSSTMAAQKYEINKF